MNPPRKSLGRRTTLVSREKVWQSADSFDVVSTSNYEVVQRSVLFEDVRLVTYHREYGRAFMIAMGLLSGGMLSIAIFVGLAGSWPAAGILSLFALPFVIPFLIRLAYRLDVITIFGRRSKALLQFRLRKRRAREVYGQICATVRAAQRAVPAPPSAAAENVPDDVAGAFPLPDRADDRAADDDGVAPPA